MPFEFSVTVVGFSSHVMYCGSVPQLIEMAPRKPPMAVSESDSAPWCSVWMLIEGGVAVKVKSCGLMVSEIVAELAEKLGSDGV